MEQFNIRGLTFAYPEESRAVLSDVSLTIRQGEFVLMSGLSGSGKTTLLRQLKPELRPHGTRQGEILFRGKPLEAMDRRASAGKIGFIMQDPDNQIAADKVWHELAFGLESLGASDRYIRRRVAETASFFGIENWFDKNVTELSGGQKQLLNLASVMVMEPEVLILDEPSGKLDPVAAGSLMADLGRINRELGVTVILSEHRLEEALHLCDRLLIVDRGTIRYEGAPAEVIEELSRDRHPLMASMPAPVKIWNAVGGEGTCPLNVAQGRRWLQEMLEKRPAQPLPELDEPEFGDPVIRLKEVSYRYERKGPEVLRGLDLQVCSGEMLCILGGNGAGKSTLLQLLAGSLKGQSGRVQVNGKTALIPQDPKLLFVKSRVGDDLKLDHADPEQLNRVIDLCQIRHLLDRHPYDLSGGEQQRAALAKVLLQEPDILLLDEPTKGIDTAYKNVFAKILRRLTSMGRTVVMVSHDVEFCSEHADSCAMLFRGEITAEDAPLEFFSGGSYYSPAAERMSRNLIPYALTCEDVVMALGGKMETPDGDGIYTGEGDLGNAPEGGDDASTGSAGDSSGGVLPQWRQRLALIAFAIALADFGFVLQKVELISDILNTGSESVQVNDVAAYGILIVSLLVMMAAVFRRTKVPGIADPSAARARSKRNRLAALMILAAVPLTIYAGIHFLDDRKYYFISMLIILEVLLPFAVLFEKRRPQARELVITAVLCAIAVAGRAAFMAVPGLKPVMALVIIAGVAFGGETGFLVGAVTMFLSNIMFGQGPWTPWQMFAMGLVGFLAGTLFRKGLLSRSRLSLGLFGLLSAILIYGGLMNPAAVFMFQEHVTIGMILTAYFTGFPVDLLHGAATFVFLWILSGPMLEKLDRIKVKYGLLE